MPARPCSASSTGTHTPDSTSTGEAPGYGTAIVTTSSSTSGNISWRSIGVASRPPASSMAISKFAATGLRANQAIGPLTD